MPTDRSYVRSRLDHGREYPFDGTDAWWSSDIRPEAPAEPLDWAVRAARGIVTGGRLDYRAELDASHALQRLFKNIGLQLALTSKFDVAKFGTAGAANTCFFPEVRYTVL